MIYFIRHPEGQIKIGTTVRLSRRLKQLRLEHQQELEVLGVMDGSYEEEKRIHDLFSHLRISGEWFRDSDDLIDYIRDHSKSWDISDQRMSSRTFARIEEDIFYKANAVSSLRNIKLTRYLSQLLRQAVEEDFAEEVKKEISRIRRKKVTSDQTF